MVPEKQSGEVTEPKAPVVNVEEVRAKAKEEATSAERARIGEIRAMVKKAGLADEFAADLEQKGIEVEQARSLVIDKVAEVRNAAEIQNKIRASGGQAANLEERRAGMENAILNIFDSKKYELSEAGRNFRNLRLSEMARSHLEANGINTSRMIPMELAGAALGLSRMHTTSDFAEVLANVAGKTLRDGYESAPKTYDPFVREVEAPDFKQMSSTSLNGNFSFEKVNEKGEFRRGTLAEGAEKYSLATWGKIIAITRQIIVNDDMGAFTRVPFMLGVAASDLLGDMVWEIVTGNPKLADGKEIYHSDHKNLGSAGTLTAITLGELRKLTRIQKKLDGKPSNLNLAYLAVPAALEQKALELAGAETISSTSNVLRNSFTPIIEARLDAVSTTAHYGFADKGRIDMIHLAFLRGQRGAYTESRVSFDVDGVEVKGRLDAVAKCVDFRGMTKNAG